MWASGASAGVGASGARVSRGRVEGKAVGVATPGGSDDSCSDTFVLSEGETPLKSSTAEFRELTSASAASPAVIRKTRSLSLALARSLSLSLSLSLPLSLSLSQLGLFPMCPSPPALPPPTPRQRLYKGKHTRALTFEDFCDSWRQRRRGLGGPELLSSSVGWQRLETPLAWSPPTHCHHQFPHSR